MSKIESAEEFARRGWELDPSEFAEAVKSRDAAIRAECAAEKRPDHELLETARAALAAIINKNPPILAVKDQRERNLTQARLAADAAWQYAQAFHAAAKGGGE